MCPSSSWHLELEWWIMTRIHKNGHMVDTRQRQRFHSHFVGWSWRNVDSVVAHSASPSLVRVFGFVPHQQWSNKHGRCNQRKIMVEISSGFAEWDFGLLSSFIFGATHVRLDHAAQWPTFKRGRLVLCWWSLLFALPSLTLMGFWHDCHTSQGFRKPLWPGEIIVVLKAESWIQDNLFGKISFCDDLDVGWADICRCRPNTTSLNFLLATNSFIVLLCRHKTLASPNSEYVRTTPTKNKA